MGKKYVIELEDPKDYGNGEGVYYPVTKIPWWSISAINVAKLEPLEDTLKEAERCGAESVVSLVKELFRTVPDESLFDGNYVEDIFNLYSLDVIREAFEEWKTERRNIQAWDEVIWDVHPGYPDEALKSVVLDTLGDEVWIFTENLCVEKVDRCTLARTGTKYPEIAVLMRQIGGNK